jgi:hypothetical protein
VIDKVLSFTEPSGVVMTISKADLSLRKARRERDTNKIFISIEVETDHGITKLHGNFMNGYETHNAAKELMQAMIRNGASSR